MKVYESFCLQISAAWRRSWRDGKRDRFHTCIAVVCHYANGKDCTPWIYWSVFDCYYHHRGFTGQFLTVITTTVDLLVSFWLLLPPLCCRCCRDEPIKQCRCGVEDAPRRRAIPTGFVWSWLIFDVYGSAKMTLAFFFSFCALTEVNVQPSLLFLTATVWPDWRWMLGKAASQCSKWFFIFPLAPVSLSESPSVFRSRLKTSWFHESFPQRLFWYLTQCVVRFSQVFLKILCNSWTFLRFFQLCFSRSFPRST